MEISDLHETSNTRLLTKLPADQAERVFNSHWCDIDPTFLGFVGIYERLADIIPEHWTVVDLGCAYAPQAFFFERHIAYIGIDSLTPISSRFAAPNTAHHEMTIADFVDGPAKALRKERCFAICSYVPGWHGGSGEIARRAFPNVFTYYPANDPPDFLKAGSKKLETTP